MPAKCLLVLLGALSISCSAPSALTQVVTAALNDPLPSWHEGVVKTALIDFVTRTTIAGARDFVPPAERTAVFDNDGTLWAEQPIYAQFAFALDRIKALAPQHPDWKTTQPFAAVIDGDVNGVLASGEAGLMRILAASHTAVTTDEFDAIVTQWITSARHPGTGRGYDEMVYQPMLEVL